MKGNRWMNRRVYFPLWIGLLALVTQAWAQSPLRYWPTDPSRHACAESKSRQAQRWLKNTTPGLRPLRGTEGWDLVHQDVTWEVNPRYDTLRGEVRFDYVALQSLSALTIDLQAPLRIESIRNTQGQALSYSRNSFGEVRITLARSLQAGQRDTFTVVYSGKPETSDNGGIASFNHDTLGTFGYVIWTLSQPNGAPDWWPCKNTLSDKIDSLTLRVLCPNGYVFAGQGLRSRQETQTDGRLLWEYKHKYPIPTYLVSLNVGPYVELNHTLNVRGQAVALQEFAYPDRVFEWNWTRDELNRTLLLLDSLFGTYPYLAEKYGHVHCGFGGGMEHSTLSSMGTGLDYQLTVHEVAHQWFGNKVTCASWGDLWLNESFATWICGLAYEQLERGRYWRIWKEFSNREQSKRPTGALQVSDVVPIDELFSYPIRYIKGNKVLHILRRMIGDEAMFRACRAYLNDPALAYGFATTDDLKRHLEAASGQNLDRFFAEWVRGEGYPSYTLRWQTEGSRVRLRVDQQSSAPGVVPFFHQPIYLRFVDTAQDRVHELVLNPESQGQLYEINLPWRPDSLLFDPEYEALSWGDTVIQESSPLALSYPERWQVFPNPSTGPLTLRLSGTITRQSYQIRLIDRIGREVNTWTWNPLPENLGQTGDISQVNGQWDFPLGGLAGQGRIPAGMYVLEIVQNSRRERLKLLLL